MNQKSFVASLAIFATSAFAEFQSIDVLVDDVPTTLYVALPSTWSEAQVSGDSVSFDFNNRMYLSKTPELDTAEYFTPDMLGGYMEYDVDLSQVGCGYITALYTVLMPGVDNDGDPFKYCGSGSGAAAKCPEFDIMEANMYGFRGVAHKCASPDENGVYTDCDPRG